MWGHQSSAGLHLRPCCISSGTRRCILEPPGLQDISHNLIVAPPSMSHLWDQGASSLEPLGSWRTSTTSSSSPHPCHTCGTEEPCHGATGLMENINHQIIIPPSMPQLWDQEALSWSHWAHGEHQPSDHHPPICVTSLGPGSLFVEPLGSWRTSISSSCSVSSGLPGPSTAAAWCQPARKPALTTQGNHHVHLTHPTSPIPHGGHPPPPPPPGRSCANPPHPPRRQTPSLVPGGRPGVDARVPGEGGLVAEALPAVGTGEGSLARV